jgi:hypothetical protein
MWVPGCLMPVVGECGRRLTLRDVTIRCAGHVEAGNKIGTAPWLIKFKPQEQMWTEVTYSEEKVQTLLILDV